MNEILAGDARRCKRRLATWLREAVAGGWIDEAEIGKLEALEVAGADQLFEGESDRPLTVGFFGGTGVGKSSLLNRLVGERLAEVGVERPTSTVVTLYVHEQYPLKRLEELFPVERVRVLTHGREAYRDVVWIDMPDMDSVEHANRELVFEWLPYIDWLVYVVSPERYRDDAGWRVLKERGHRHHWLFVMNRWDAGTPEQVEDFAGSLKAEGMNDPVVLRTSCAADMDDDFPRIKETVDQAVSEHGLKRLQEVGERARLRELAQQCDRYAAMLGDTAQWRELDARGRAAMESRLDVMARRVNEEAAIEAARIPDRPAPDRPPPVPEPELPGLVVDDVRDVESGIALSAEGLPREPVEAAARRITGSLAERVHAVMRDGLRTGAVAPGHAFQRGLVTGLRKLVYGLPLIGVFGIGYVVIMRYQQGLAGNGEFLGLDFLVHSLMILGLAALAPYLLARLLRPSARRSIVKRVDAGLQRLRSEVIGEWTASVEQLMAHSSELRRSLDAIRSDIRRALER